MRSFPDLGELQENLLRLEKHVAELQDSVDKIQTQKEINNAPKTSRIDLANLILRVAEFLSKQSII